MTITTTSAPAVDELIPRARELASQEGGVPSRDRLMKAFRIGRPKASQIYERLVAERAERAKERRRALRRIGSRKGLGRGLRPRPYPLPTPVSPTVVAVPVTAASAQVVPDLEGATVPVASPLPKLLSRRPRKVPGWPLLLLAQPAFVAIWSGWVALGGMTGFGVVHPLPGIADELSLNTAITLPIGLETYGTYALYVWLSGAVPARARLFAMWSALGSLALGAGGQVAYHLMAAAGMTVAPWQITTVVACLPVAVLGMGAALYHLVHIDEKES